MLTSKEPSSLRALSFSEAKFYGNAYFGGTKFFGKIDFNTAEFRQLADFSKVETAKNATVNFQG
jgi:hypothetical protein